MALSLDGSVRVPEDVVFRELDGEAVILNLESGMYFGLDAIGTRIWQLCQELGSIRLVWQAIQNEFDVSADTFHADLLSFLDELSVKGLVTIQ